ncbi:Glutathione-dependent formaldehyde-activating enzyme [Madurella fahalii]|uniref:Glutathione-dependent formaldehyde-activating enzyme n=1 Tax=Madurella fahalii TaxID=1157608 RepID=A0ABQ0GLW2_9PEZI
MSDTEKPTKKYRGNCHCTAFVFEIELPEIKSARECSCSICVKKGYMWVITENRPTIVRGEDALVSYQFASKTMEHHFCSNCGTAVMGKAPMGVGINVRALQDVDIWALEIEAYNGETREPQYVPPAFSGPEPNPAGFDEGKTYHGSCHCGAVTAAIKVKEPFEDGAYKGPIAECNCSICRRGGYIWVYPLKDQISIQGSENLTYYVYGTRVARLAICKTCGVHIYIDLNPLTDEEIAELPEAVRTNRSRQIDLRPFNLRVLNDLNLGSVKTARLDGWNERQPAYVNP